MYIYLIFYTLIVLLAIKVDNSLKETNRRFYLFIIFSLLVCFSTFRVDIGTDIGRYVKDYKEVFNLPKFSITNGLDSLPYDFLYSLLYIIFGNILKLDFWSIQLFISLVFCFGFYKLSEKINNYTLSSIILIPILYYFITFSLLRQSISICIGLYLITLILEKRYKLSFFILIIGVLFHKYFFIFGIVIVLSLIFNKRINYIKILKVFTILFSFISIFVLIYLTHLKGHFNWYVISKPANHALQYPFLKLMFINYSYIIVFLFLSLISIKNKNVLNIRNFDEENKIIFIYVLLGLFLLCIYPFSKVVTLRFMMYFIIINPLIIIKLMKFFNNKLDNLVLMLLFLLHSAYMVIFFNFSAHRGSYIPYKLYFFN